MVDKNSLMEIHQAIFGSEDQIKVIPSHYIIWYYTDYYI